MQLNGWRDCKLRIIKLQVWKSKISLFEIPLNLFIIGHFCFKSKYYIKIAFLDMNSDSLLFELLS